MNCKHCDMPVPASSMPEDGFLVGVGIDSFYECPSCQRCFATGKTFDQFVGQECNYCHKPTPGELRPTAGGKLLACVPCYHQRKALVTSLLPGAHKESYTKPAADFVGTFANLCNEALR